MSISSPLNLRIEMDKEGEFFSPYRRYEPVSVVFMAWTLAMCLMGCIGNSLVIGAVLVHKKLRTLGNIFVTNLAVADMIVALFVSTFGMLGILSDGYFYKDRVVLCNLIGMVCIIACSCSLWSIAAISLNRYVIICHRFHYQRIYNVRTVPIMVAGIWFVCFLVDLPNLIGWGRHSFDERLQMCTYDFTYKYSYTLFFISVGLGFPLCVSVLSYYQILKVSRKSNRILVLRAIGTTHYNQSIVTKKQMQADQRILKSVLIILIVFVLMWTPHAVAVLGDYYARWPRLVHVIGAALAHGSSSINSCIHAAYNRDFRRGYKVFLKYIYERIRIPFTRVKRNTVTVEPSDVINLTTVTPFRSSSQCRNANVSL